MRSQIKFLQNCDGSVRRWDIYLDVIVRGCDIYLDVIIIIIILIITLFGPRKHGHTLFTVKGRC